MVGLAGTWLAAADTGLAPHVVGDTLLALAGALWVVALVAYAVHVAAHRGTLSSDLSHPVLSPFLSLAVITPMVLAARGVAPWAPSLGSALVDVFLAATVLHGAWFTGALIAGEYAIDAMHPFALRGPAIDTVATLLAGYGVLMVLAQVRLVPIFARLRFGIGFWAFTFAWAAVATTALHWIGATRPAGGTVWAWLLLVAISLLVAGVAARSVAGLARGTLFARPVPEPAVAAAS